MQVLTVDLYYDGYTHRQHCVRWVKQSGRQMTVRLLTDVTIVFRDVVSYYISNKDIVEGYIQEALINTSAMIPLEYKDAIVKRLHNKYKKQILFGSYYPDSTSPSHIKITISD